MLTNYDSNLPAEQRRMNRFTEVQKRATIRSYSHIWLALECQTSYLLSTNASVHTATSGEKTIHSFLITHLVLECWPTMTVTYMLSTSECTGSHSSKWRKKQPFILNHTSFVRNLHAEPQVNAQVHTASGEKSNHSRLITILLLC